MTSFEPTESRCALHPEAEAVAPCMNCGTFACTACLEYVGNRGVCVTCLEDGRVKPYALAWLHREDLGLFRAWWMTVSEMLSRPAPFFESMPADTPMRDAFRFAGFSIGITAAFLTGLSLFLCGGGGRIVALAGEPQGGGLVAAAGVFYALLISMSPLCILSFFILTSHPLMLILRGGGKGFGASLRVCFYTLGFYPAATIPCFSMLFILGILAYQIIGYSKIHEEPVWKASVAVLLPLAFGGMLYILGVAFSSGLFDGL